MPGKHTRMHERHHKQTQEKRWDFPHVSERSFWGSSMTWLCVCSRPLIDARDVETKGRCAHALPKNCESAYVLGGPLTCSMQCKRPQTRPKGSTNLVAKPQVSANTLPAAAKRRGSLRNCERGGEGGVVTLMRRCSGCDSEHASCSRVRHDGICSKSSEVDMTACSLHVLHLRAAY
jgi:hypothetical protein